MRVSRSLGKSRKGRARHVVIEALQQQDIGGRVGENTEDGSDLGVFVPDQVTQQNAGALAVQFDIPGGDAQGVGLRREGAQAGKDQAVCRAASSELA